MKRYCCIVLLILISTTVFAQIGGRAQVAVMNLDASGIEQSAIIALSDRLRSELINTGRFDVMERNRMDVILKEQGFQQSGACTTTECVVQMGQLLGVERMISGSVGKVGRIYTLSVRMIDIETGRIMISKTEDCECPIEKVLTQSIRNIALKMAGLSPGQAPAGESLPTVVAGNGDFYFKSDPPGAKVYIDNKEISGVTPNSVEGVQAGLHVIRMVTERYSGSETVFLEPNEFKRVELKLERSKGGVKVITSPFEAELFIDNTNHGLTPQTVSGLDAGEHIVRITKKGYVDFIERVQIRGDKTSRIEANLVKWAYLTITSSPDEADVFVDNSIFGKTPMKNKQIEPGSHDISVRKSGYVSVNKTEKFNEGKLSVFNTNLQLTSSLQVTSEPAGATIYIDGESYGSTPATFTDLPPGTRKVQLSGEMFEDWLGGVELIPGQRKNLHADLVLKKGSISLSSNISGAEILIDDKKVGSIPATINGIDYGNHKITVIKENYKSFEKMIQLLESGPVNVQADLEIAMASLDLAGSPPGAEVRLDGKSIGNLPLKNVQVPPGKHTIIMHASGYEEYKQIVAFDPNETKNVNMSLNRKTRGKAFIRSLVVPGLGQRYSEHTGRSILYPVLEIAAIGGIFLANNQYNSAIDDYDAARQSYLNAISDSEINTTRIDMDNKYDDITGFENTRNVLIGAAVGIWVVNILDALLFDSKVKADYTLGESTDLKPDLYIARNKEQIKIGLNVHF